MPTVLQSAANLLITMLAGGKHTTTEAHTAPWLQPFGVPAIFLANKLAASASDPGTRLCSASSATGSAEQRGRHRRRASSWPSVKNQGFLPPPSSEGGFGALPAGDRRSPLQAPSTESVGPPLPRWPRTCCRAQRILNFNACRWQAYLDSYTMLAPTISIVHPRRGGHWPSAKASPSTHHCKAHRGRGNPFSSRGAEDRRHAFLSKKTIDGK